MVHCTNYTVVHKKSGHYIIDDNFVKFDKVITDYVMSCFYGPRCISGLIGYVFGGRVYWYKETQLGVRAAPHVHLSVTGNVVLMYYTYVPCESKNPHHFIFFFKFLYGLFSTAKLLVVYS